MTKQLARFLIVLLVLGFASTAWSLEIACRIGDKWPESHPAHEKGWRDGQIVEIREDGFFKGNRTLKDFVIIRLDADFWTLRGSTDWKSSKASVLELKKYTSVKDSLGKYDWETGSIASTGTYEAKLLKRERFVDFKKLLNDGYITQKQYDSIYDKKIDNEIVVIHSKTLDEVLQIEGIDTRLER